MNTTGIKTGGRTIGTPNKVTKELRTILKNFLFNELENIETYINELPPKEKLDMIFKLFPYVLPRVKEIDHNKNEPMEINYMEY